jgi:hypothetical protein
LGTLLIGYVLIPFLANSVTMYITAGILAWFRRCTLSFGAREISVVLWRSR